MLKPLLKTFITIFTNFLSDLFSFSSALEYPSHTGIDPELRVQHFYFSEKQLIINLCISEIKKKDNH